MTMTWRFPSCAALTLLVLLVRSVQATDYYLDSSALPGGNGSASMPFNQANNINIGALAHGDTIFLHPGEYARTTAFTLPFNVRIAALSGRPALGFCAWATTRRARNFPSSTSICASAPRPPGATSASAMTARFSFRRARSRSSEDRSTQGSAISRLDTATVPGPTPGSSPSAPRPRRRPSTPRASTSAAATPEAPSRGFATSAMPSAGT